MLLYTVIVILMMKGISCLKASVINSKPSRVQCIKIKHFTHFQAACVTSNIKTPKKYSDCSQRNVVKQTLSHINHQTNLMPSADKQCYNLHKHYLNHRLIKMHCGKDIYLHLLLNS